MSSVKVITDTDSSLPSGLAAKYDISQVPITIQFGEETFQACIDIDDKVLFEKIDFIKQLPTTAAPSPAAFSQEFQTSFKYGAESIICVCVGSKISRTYESAVAATADFPGRKITIVDSEFLSLGQGFMAIAAAEAVAAGASHEEAVQAARSLLGRMHLYGSLTTLKYLAMGGRIGHVAAGVADIFDIRPIMTMNDGKLGLLEKVRTHRVAMEKVVRLLEKAVEGKVIEKAGIVHVNNLKDAGELEYRLRHDLAMPEEILTAEFTPGLSVHGGTGLFAGVFLTRT